ncbi:MAG: KilA-N domain-containing protein [Rikenellaceae bacterium]|nr:KilA-N domain-containing protein [Rikenellaceae bacterium]
MLHTSKGRKLAIPALISDGAQLSQIFNYNANPVTFRTIDGALMVNATQMAKPFQKTVYAWLRLPSSKAYISAVIQSKNTQSVPQLLRNGRRNQLNKRELRQSNLVITRKGGRNGGGTYFHEDIAIEFARWLSPAFAVWCNDRIKELFKQSVAQPQPQAITLDDVLSRLREATDLLTALKREREERERLEAILSGIKSQIDTAQVARLPISTPTLF